MRYKIITSVLGMGVVVLWLVLSPGTKPSGLYTPDAYTAQVDALINARLLRVTCPPDSTPQIDDSLLRSDKAETATSNELPATSVVPIASESQKKWYANSYLKDDVRRFNEEPKYNWIFMISDSGCELVGIHKRAHRISMPFAHQDNWSGSIFYNGKTTGTALRSIKRQLTLHQARADAQSATQNKAKNSSNNIAQAANLPAAVRTTEVGAPESVEAEQVELRAKNTSTASIQYVGDQLVVNNLLRAETDGSIGLMGYAMPLGRRAWLDTGDWLQIYAGGGSHPAQEVFVFTNSTPLPVASATYRRNDHDERSTQDDYLGWFYDNDTDQPIPFLEVLAQRIGTMANLRPDTDKTAAIPVTPNFNIQLSINPQLQRTISKEFHAICDGYRRGTNGGQPFKAGVTVLDGKTGDILAAATYPWPEDIPYNLKNTDRMLLNQNFIRHPIGSIIKPFLYSAIADTYPYFTTMTINAYGGDKKHQDILYCQVKPGYQIHAMGGSGSKKTNKSGKAQKDSQSVGAVDFSTALARSSNKYTVELATLALAADANGIRETSSISWPGRASSGIKINGRTLSGVPDFSQYIDTGTKTTAPISCRQLKNMDLLPYLEAFERITGVPTYGGKAPTGLRTTQHDSIYRAYTAQDYDTVPLQPLVAYFTSNDAYLRWEMRATLAGVAPEQVNLQFNYLRNFRQDYVSLTLGSGNSVWTNIQVAAALSSLVTDTRVRSRLITTLLDDSGQPITHNTDNREKYWGTPLNLNPTVRKYVLTGLAGVVGYGTATGLQKPLASLQNTSKGYRLFVFSKTGTPTVERTIDRDVGSVLKTLHRSYLTYNDGKLQIAVQDQTTSYEPSNTSKFITVLNNVLVKLGYRQNRLSAISNDLMDIFAAWQRDSNASAADADQDAESGTATGPLEVVGGRLVLNVEDPTFRSRRRKSRAAAYVFSLVKLPTALIGQQDNIPTPAQIQDPRTQVLTTAIYLDLPYTSAEAVKISGQLLNTIGNFHAAAE